MLEDQGNGGKWKVLEHSKLNPQVTRLGSAAETGFHVFPQPTFVSGPRESKRKDKCRRFTILQADATLTVGTAEMTGNVGKP